jgi:phosphatidylglycerophosphate synthase
MNVWRERVQRWIAPMARTCPFSPNGISLTAAALNLVAATLLSRAGTHRSLFLWMLLPMALGGALDALDGAVARTQGLESRFGDFLDHFLDRLSDLALLAGWCIGTEVRAAVAFPALIAVMLNGYVGTQTEASFGVRSYEGTGRGEYVLGMIALPLVMYSVASLDWSHLLWLGMTFSEWATALLGITALLGVVQRLLKAKRLGDSSG